MAATFCISGDAIIKAGAGVGAVPATAWDSFIEEAEGLCSQVSRYDWVANWAVVSGNSIAPLLKEIASNIAAIYGVAYDMSGYTTRIEAEDIINTLRDATLRGLSQLRDQKGVTFGK